MKYQCTRIATDEFRRLRLFAQTLACKVVRAAEQQLKEILAGANLESLGNFFAEFDPATSALPTRIERIHSTRVDRIVKFSTSNWSTVDASIPDAVNQMASVFAALARSAQFAAACKEAGLMLVPTSTEQERIANDPDKHASVFINIELTTDQFFSLLDRAEAKLHSSNTGAVSGSGWGVRGWCLDLSSPSIEECLAIAVQELDAEGVSFEVSRH